MKPSALLAVAFALLAGLYVGSPAARAAAPAVGDAVPPLGVESLMNAPDGASADWEKLKGKVVVVEFWATWCGPCVAAIPHMNELAERFADKGVAFLSITAEPKETIDAFTKRLAMKSWIGLDPDGSAFEAFAVRGIPRTIIVGKDGKVLADTYPTFVKAEHLEAALRGERPDLPVRPGDDVEIEPLRPTSGPSAAAETPAAIVEAWVRPAAKSDGRQNSMMGGNVITITNADATDLVNQAYNGRMAGARLSLEAELPEGRYDLYISVPVARSFQVDELLWDTVAFAFGLQKEVQERDTDVYLLRTRPGEKGKLPPVETGPEVDLTQYGADVLGLDIRGAKMWSLVFKLDNFVGRPLLDDTARRDAFDVKVDLPTWRDGRPPSLEELNAPLAEVGLELVPARRSLPYTVVTRRPTSQELYEAKQRAATRPSTRPAE